MINFPFAGEESYLKRERPSGAPVPEAGMGHDVITSAPQGWGPEGSAFLNRSKQSRKPVRGAVGAPAFHTHCLGCDPQFCFLLG